MTHKFVHLHFHTEYSMLDGACQVDRAMKMAKELGMPALAMTDHGNLYGVINFYIQAQKEGVKPILGCEVYVAHGSMHDKKLGDNRSQSNHLVLLAEDEAGFNNLMHLVSKAHLEGFYYKPRIDKELLARHCKGLIALSSCLKGEVAELCVEGKLNEAVRVADEFSSIMGKNNFYIELQDHGLPDQKKANRALLQVAKKLALPLVATNDVHYLKAEHAAAHEVLLCLQTQTVMSDPKRMTYGSNQFYMKTGEEMLRMFSETPEAIAHTWDIAERCNVKLNLEKELHFPSYHCPDDAPHLDYLVKLTHEGLRARYGLEDAAHPKNEAEKQLVARLHHELAVINKTGFVNYFLVVWDFIHAAKARGIPVGPGRGSGAGSLVAYALGITGLDPLRYGLIFERFLNPERVSPPDFDIDFCQTRRGEVIEYVKDKYGRDSVAQIITFGTLGAKTVLRDIGRALEIPLSECDKLAKMVPEDPNMTLEKALKDNPEFRKTCEQDPHAREIMKYALVLEGLPRQPSTHAAGVVIGEKPLIELVPLARDKDKEIITQYEMTAIEKVGLLKMDFLGLKTLTVIQEAVDNVRKTRQQTLDIDTIPVDDQLTYDLLNRGDTVGVFQVESSGMRDLLRRMGLTCIEELLALIALYRPGPMQFIDAYIDGKHGRTQIKYDHPLLEPILKETYGIFVYQEQVQQAANALAGFSLGQGDILRRAMGKKKKDVMDQQRSKFVEGCHKANRISAAKAGEIFDKIAKFAEYGFNKSHSAAYGIVTFQTAYLKAHYPVEFMAALLSSEIGNTDKLPILVAEAQTMGIEVLPPNVNDSEQRFKPVGDKIRYGLAAVKNVGEAAVEGIIREREAHGPYQGLVDFCMRMENQLCNRKTLESLVKCGSFDFTGLMRARLFAGIELALNKGAQARKDKASGQTSLFAMLGDTHVENSDAELPEADAWPESQMLAAEKELLGFYISGHPLTAHAWVLQKFSLSDCNALKELPADTMTRVGGLVSGFQKKFTKKDQKPMGVFRLDHLDGELSVVAFPEAFEQFGVHLREEAPVMVCGQVRREEDGISLIAKEIYPLADVPKMFAQWVGLHIQTAGLTDDKLQHIREVITRHPGPTPLSLCLLYPNGSKVFIKADKGFCVDASEKLVRELEHLVGESSVYVGVNKKPCRRANGNGTRAYPPRAP